MKAKPQQPTTPTLKPAERNPQTRELSRFAQRNIHKTGRTGGYHTEDRK